MSKSVLVRSFYKPEHGGHAPGDIRSAFLEAITAYEVWEDGEPKPCVEVCERPAQAPLRLSPDGPPRPTLQRELVLRVLTHNLALFA